ncbi:hypothetical protein [Sphingomonas hankyongi]|uniref:Adhesin n=1 Tax=Sphingomonas hankyongi TaxID=2908209 RepID=A0ABT0S2Z2_9SPHN|nr:hypothetical protein [Sphingomonas hankyongi]MCL6729966.1 hypothetical protein [Sphingomonas hankyongi]
MRKCLLLAGVATALAIAPTAASASETGRGEITFSNNVDTSIYDHFYRLDATGIFGGVLVYGVVNPDSAAVAVTDAKQIMSDSDVAFREENELNGENGYVDPIFGPGWSEAGQDPNDNLTDGVFQGQIRAGFFAPIINNATTGDIDADGNVGVNVAAGQYNQQQNSANIAVSASAADASDDGDDPSLLPDGDGDGGWASAYTTGYQSLTGTSYGGLNEDTLPEDDEEAGGGGNNFRDRNTATTGEVAGDGNIGVNVAAGAFNQQQNLMTLAVASNAVLAQSNAALWQTSSCNYAEIQDEINNATSGAITGAGNIGVNVAAGVGNQQQNSLTAAVSGDFGGGSGGGTGGGSDPS